VAAVAGVEGGVAAAALADWETRMELIARRVFDERQGVNYMGEPLRP